MKFLYIILLISVILLYGCQKDRNSVLDDTLSEALIQASAGKGVSFFMLPQETDFNAIPQDPKNPLSAAKVALGKLLFHESALGNNPVQHLSTGTYSCASCHFASGGFQACKSQGLGEGGMGFGLNGESRIRNPLYKEADMDVQPIRTPTALNIAYQTNILWNGQFGATHLNVGTESSWEYGTPKATNLLGYQGAETQAIAGMTVHRQGIDKAWADQFGYSDMFRAAFPGIPDDLLFTKEYAGLAIAAYERTLLAYKAPFQEWLRGKTGAMSEKEKRGAIVFFKDANCTQCHTGPALSSMTFHALGMNDLYFTGGFKANPQNPENLGRGGFTKNPADHYKFKTPQLYNLKDSPFYGHGASFTSIKDVIVYKNIAVRENTNVPASQLSPWFLPQQLTAAQIEDLTAFITFALRDPNLARYQPSSVNSGACIPNNDPLSKSDLKCQ